MIKQRVSALFVRPDSIYKQLDVDCWDIERNALNWGGGNPVIAHPPCRAWGKLSHFAKPRPDEKYLAIWSIDKIRSFGGVLEHPIGSSLWKELQLPLGRQVDKFGGFSISIDQSWFGHKAQKKTLLYICGCDRKEIEPMPISFDAIEYTVAPNVRKGQPGWRPSITKSEREATPIQFAKWLITVAEKCFIKYDTITHL